MHISLPVLMAEFGSKWLLTCLYRSLSILDMSSQGCMPFLPPLLLQMRLLGSYYRTASYGTSPCRCKWRCLQTCKDVGLEGQRWTCALQLTVQWEVLPASSSSLSSAAYRLSCVFVNGGEHSSWAIRKEDTPPTLSPAVSNLSPSPSPHHSI